MTLPAAPRLPAARAPEPSASDAELLDHIGAADSAGAFKLLYNRHEGLVHRTVQALLGRQASPDDILDAAAETWIRIWKSAGAFRGESLFSTWAYRIARSTVVDRVRRENGVALHFVSDEKLEEAATRHIGDREEVSPEDSVDRARLVNLLKQCIAALPERNRTVVELTYIQGLAQAEVAQHLEISEGTVKSRLHYGKNRLREILKHYGAERYLQSDADLVLFHELTPQQIARLESRGIHTLAALADLSWTELVEVLEPMTITEEDARRIVMQARAQRFDWKPPTSDRGV